MRRASSLLALPLALSLVGEQATAEENSGGVSCEIRSVGSSDAVTLRAVVLSLHPASGEYELEVKKSGGGGTSSSAQAGDFEVAADGETVLSELTIGGGGAINARLTVWSAAGSVICSADYPGKK